MAQTLTSALPDIHKIAFLRPNALGDFIFALPALRALRETYPQAEIVYLGKQWHAQFIPGHVPTVDRVVVVPPYSGVGEPEGAAVDQTQIDTFFEQMRAEHFDLAVQAYGGGGHSNPFLLHLGAKHTVGTRTPESVPLGAAVPYQLFHNEILRWLEVVSYAGAQTKHIVPELTVLDADRKEAHHQLFEHDIEAPYVVIHPGATDKRRHWPSEYFGQVANHLIKTGYRVIVTGVSSEKDIVDAVVAATHDKAVPFCGNLTIGGMTGLLAEAALVLSNDTGPLHVAGAVGAKTVGIYWVGNLITAGHMTRMYDRPHISWTVNCPVCGTSCVTDPHHPWQGGCAHQESFVADVQPEDVLASCLSLLK